MHVWNNGCWQWLPVSLWLSGIIFFNEVAQSWLQSTSYYFRWSLPYHSRSLPTVLNFYVSTLYINKKQKSALLICWIYCWNKRIFGHSNCYRWTRWMHNVTSALTTRLMHSIVQLWHEIPIMCQMPVFCFPFNKFSSRIGQISNKYWATAPQISCLQIFNLPVCVRHLWILP